MKCAGIDIGTNTILMVIGEQSATGWHIVADHHRIARLGEGLDASGVISHEAVARAVTILADYHTICSGLNVQKITVVATSAMRQATNGEHVKMLLETAIGAQIAIITGLEEAALTLHGVTSGRDKPCLVIDIGGGSTEYIAGFSRIVFSAFSLEFGVVRFAERYQLGGLAQPANVQLARDLVHRHLISVKDGLKHFPIEEIIAVAGTPTSLAILDLRLTSFDKDRVEGHVLTAGAISYWADRLLGMTAEERLALPGMDPNRVDILPAGVLILDQSLKDLECSRCTVSIKGLRYGVMMS